MTAGFRRFVIFAGMRTGSNLLEATLNRISGITCHGEAFNPDFLGWPDNPSLEGVSLSAREADPFLLLDRLFARPGHLSGFRYFHDHDPRIFQRIIEDRDCAKIVLTRNPLESYVSTKLARRSGQWKLNVHETPDEGPVAFEAIEFRETLAAYQDFLGCLRRRLQLGGQTAFWLDYCDLRDSEVLTGLLHWLGRSDIERVEPARDLIPQNPGEMTRKLSNPEVMRAEIAALDPFAISNLPGLEPGRGPVLRSYSAFDAGLGVIYMPIPGGPDVALQGLGPPRRDFTQATLRDWKRQHPGHCSFTILSHPLIRACRTFRDLGRTATPELRAKLAGCYKVHLPEEGESLCEGEFPDRLLPFLRFLRRNLNAQTGLPTHPAWASQAAVLAGFARLYSPDLVMREGRLAEGLTALSVAVGIATPVVRVAKAHVLDDPRLIEAAHAAYLRDYIAFGFAKDPFARARQVTAPGGDQA
jgi:hypothetical protein